MNCQVTFLLLSAIVACVMSCEVPCTKELVPVCGTDGDNFVVFSNECVMSNQKCKDGKIWTKSDLRSCSLYDSRDEEEITSVCLKACSLLVVPVCGYNGENYKLFGNTCAMENANCLLREGKIYAPVALNMCEKSTDVTKSRASNLSNCPSACFAIYEPTCAYDGNEYKIFGNKCSLEAYSCLRSESWQAVSLELCPQDQ